MPRSFLTCAFLMAALSAAPPLAAQPTTARTTTQPKVISTKTFSAADKAAIIKLFDGVDPTKYQLRFNDGKEVYGRKTVAMNDLTQLSRTRTPGERGYIVFVVEGDNVVYVLAVGSGDNIKTVLGEQKASQLNAILAKYPR